MQVRICRNKNDDDEKKGEESHPRIKMLEHSALDASSFRFLASVQASGTWRSAVSELSCLHSYRNATATQLHTLPQCNCIKPAGDYLKGKMPPQKKGNHRCTKAFVFNID
jgi:hypothetical protein